MTGGFPPPRSMDAVVLARRPAGMVAEADLSFERRTTPELRDGTFIVRNEWFSLDPAMRGWMSAGRSYIEPVRLGDVMRAFAAGRVVASRHPLFKTGDRVTGLFGLQEYCQSDGTGVRRPPDGVSLSQALGPYGLPGITAWFGLFDICRPKAGETVVVSAAAGAVGSLVVQLAFRRGCRVVGIAGSAQKCAWVRTLGAEICIDYRAGNLSGALKDACPKGVDAFFDNVGGEILDHVLRRLNPFARIAICGAISQYNSREIAGPKNYLSLLANRALMQGFIYFDYADRFEEAEAELAPLILCGDIQFREDVVVGLESAAGALLKLFEGSNTGKLLVRIPEVTS